MRTRNSYKRQRRSSVNDFSETTPSSADGHGTPGQPRGDPSGDVMKRNINQCPSTRVQWIMTDTDIGEKGSTGTTVLDKEDAGKSCVKGFEENQDETDESDWEDGLIHDSATTSCYDKIKGVTIEFSASPDSSNRKPIRRFTAEDKEVAELVHKVHLLCLIARGRLIDNACNDPLIQATLLSLLPPDLLQVSEDTKLTANTLAPLVTWFHKNFHVISPTFAETPIHSAFLHALETQGGTIEEVVALSVALFRALNLTTRYCTKWYKISSKRVNCAWWDAVLAPLKEFESGATGGVVHLYQHELNDHDNNEMVSTMRSDRATLEDMELETRALTDPLPSNQQAYRNHPLYAIEKWLTKYQILHPKGPVLGFCSGHPVYPRSCVQELHTKERWLHEALQVRAGELPVKVVKSTSKHHKGQVTEVDDSGEGGSDGSAALYGKWQTEPLHLQPAMNGIVPKNERNQVDVWSEKCLPPGTVHLRLPRLVPVARRLEIDFAPAMVGFEFRNGRSYPVYEGIVVCAEFKDAILEAYAEEEERREEEGKRKNERQAISRWYQLLSSIVIRQRLENSYRDSSSRQPTIEPPSSDDRWVNPSGNGRISPSKKDNNAHEIRISDPASVLAGNHEHVFVDDDESFEDGILIQTKRCHCGFSVKVEEL